MELAPCNESVRQTLVRALDRLQIDVKQAEYIVKLFPNVLLDVSRLLIEQATHHARQTTNVDQAESIRQQLKPFFTFGFLLGRSPQITSLMYSYFEQSSFQPLPEEFFRLSSSPDSANPVIYAYSGFSDDLVRDILRTYFKYLVFNPKLFSSVWNWAELGRIVALHPNHDLRYLALCNLSIITRPDRGQHWSLLRDLNVGSEMLIDLQTRYCRIYDNVFTPFIESNQEKRELYLDQMGRSETGYSFDSQTLAKVTNILLLKHDLPSSSAKSEIENKISNISKNFIPVATLNDAISRAAYAASINKPCLVRGLPGSGKTSLIHYIAAQTNRVSPPAFIKVQLGDHIDSKILVGSYVCTEIPGQFEWQPGPLTQAMAYGSWIVFEDIDSAPSEMAQVIHSVIENGNLSCVASCPIKIDSPHPDFRIFFTQRTNDTSRILKLGFGFVERLCDIVDLPELTKEDLKEIITSRYSFGKTNHDFVEKIIQLYRSAIELTEEINISRAARLLTLRDLFKFCGRLNLQKIHHSSEGKYSQNDLDAMLCDAIDCFVAFMPEQFRVGVAQRLGQVINEPSEGVRDMILKRKPEIRVDSSSIFVGRARLDVSSQSSQSLRTQLANTRQSAQLLESVSLCVKNREPVLLVGETGVGKTSIIQHLSSLVKIDLIVLNLSQQTDSSDLLGGYRPVDMRELMLPINDRFMELFKRTFDAGENKSFLARAEGLFVKSKKCSDWLTYVKLMLTISKTAIERCSNPDIRDRWVNLLERARKLSKRMSNDNSSPMALSFSEGTLLRAVRKGKWLLLDEINLAEPDVLQCLSLILDSLQDSYVYMLGTNQENEGIVKIHPNFRIFACMNPSTDVGKKDLPVSTRARFTEFFLDDVTEKHELRLIVESYVKTCLSTVQIERIVEFYQKVRAQSNCLSDISGNSPVYSLRTLCRALIICAQNMCRKMDRSLLESIIITFFQQLNRNSVSKVSGLIESTIFPQVSLDKLNVDPIQKPQDDHEYIDIEGFWIQTSSQPKVEDKSYILTDSVRENLKRISRIVSLGQRKLPILIQGNTSVGKTSLINYLARLTGNKCYRINNHEHTDLQDYVGRYVLRESGELQFQEGLLVTAMKKGYWVILDELNLAPCELLEALNRVLDDNRELFIPDTREVVHAHSKFMVFATQNPPEEYAGRKILSRAFRNRFIELNFDEIPSQELEEILHKRCNMPPQYAKKIVKVMRELQMFRRESGCFSGKNSFMTMRDLFRWGERYNTFRDTVRDDQTLDWEEFLATEGLILLEGRVRTLNEADTVKMIIEKVFKRKLVREAIYSYSMPSSLEADPKFRHVDFNSNYRKIFVQLSQALKYSEPVLLCGQTGCGKTTACEIFAKIVDQELLTYNCHLNTECSDFIGNVRPSRSDEKSSSGIQKFPWVDGSLIQAMRKGSIFLMDEISLADDAVLERINSVLEPDRSMTLTEKDGEQVIAKSSFRFVATMNPGGDYGKKELSTALRNRFTEIYCHNPMDVDQILKVIDKAMNPVLQQPKIYSKLVQVFRKFLKGYYKGQTIISLRDVVSLVQFLNKTTLKTRIIPLSVQQAIIDGAQLVLFDQFGTCGFRSSRLDATEELKIRLQSKLQRLVDSIFGRTPILTSTLQYNATPENEYIKIEHYALRKGAETISEDNGFIFDAKTVASNQLKIVRALQLDRPILLEGDPGAGKTSIVAALAKKLGHKLVRINLSEQTDISDLFGSDLPDASNASDDAPRFCWHDGPLLTAIKKSSWILLDEMNLASQSVLEGLNACFDHRGEIFIPELNKKFTIDRSTTRIFACQNPHDQGAARKGLPQSFLNRFTSIFVQSHTSEDLATILTRLYPRLSQDIISRMIDFNAQLNQSYRVQGYEFNLRDLIYWCDLTTRYVQGNDFCKEDLYDPGRFVQFVYIDRLRSTDEKAEVGDLFEGIFNYQIYEPPYREFRLGESSMIFGRSILMRKKRPSPHLFDLCILKYQMPYLESIAVALESNKMPILVGQTGSGKRTMVRILAGLTGNDLDIIAANRDMDTVELLGSYEQSSIQREMVDLVQDATNYVNSLMNTISNRTSDGSWTQLYKHVWSSLYATANRDLKLSKSEMMEAYRYQLSQMDELMIRLEPLAIHTTETTRKALQARIKSLTKKVLYQSESTYSSGNFEWIDSVLVKAVRDGRWLMIENANLMNPATLDRLNSLVETDGSLSMNEKGSRDGSIELLKPHPNFRLILTMNPEHGELSRAMRNRGVEVYVRTRFYFEDFLMLLQQNGFKPDEGKACLSYCIMQTCYDAHLKITGEEAEKDGALLAYFGLNYLNTMAQQIRRGVEVVEILTDLMMSYYNQKGFLDNKLDSSICSHIMTKFEEYKKKYVVALNDDRYKWCNFMHDLVEMTGGDAITAMLSRENRIFWDNSDPVANGLLKVDEIIDSLDIVNTCISVKIFMELSSQGDFEYRKGLIRETFTTFPKFMDTVNKQVNYLHQDCMPLINSDMPCSDLVPVSEMFVDTRNSPDLQYYLQAIDYKGSVEREDIQNRWLLTLHRITIKMIIELIEDRSLDIEGHTNLYMLSEKTRAGDMLKEDLIRPQAEIAVDIHDLLIGILRVVGDRCFDNNLVPKMLSRFFWIGYFLCKLRRGYNKMELIAICNQIPMLWTLTYQKVVVPIIKDCALADLTYNSRKFSDRIKDICEFLGVNIEKPSHVEKEYYSKIINLHAATTKRHEIIGREVNKFFSHLLGKYTLKSQTPSLGSSNLDVLAASGLVWTNSNFLLSMYRIHDIMMDMESYDDDFEASNQANTILEEAKKILRDKRIEFKNHEDLMSSSQHHRARLFGINRRRSALDQFAPIWQIKFIQIRLSLLNPEASRDVKHYNDSLRRMIYLVNGIMLSPRYYATLVKFFKGVAECSRIQIRPSGDTSVDELNKTTNSDCPDRQIVDMYVAFLIDHLMENIVLDHQVVGWTKMRVTTSDLSSAAPLIPEYAPIISLVSSYCLDIAHLKLNSYQRPSPQLESMLIYLWRSYALIKNDPLEDLQDIALAKNLIHARCMETQDRRTVVGGHECPKPGSSCTCVEAYIKQRGPRFSEIIQIIKAHADVGDAEVLQRSIKLIHFGFYHMLEFAPIFTLDPSLRSREKLEVYNSELAHIKLDLSQRNTLYYWKTGENLRLVDISPDEAKPYPFSLRVLVERRHKLEKSIRRLRKDYTNRPKTDDGTLYLELRKEVEITIHRYTQIVEILVRDIIKYVSEKNQDSRAQCLGNLNTKCRMLIKSVETTISRFRSDYVLYSDLTSRFMLGLCFMLQGFRRLYSRLEPKTSLIELGFTHSSVEKFSTDIMRVFSFNQFTLNDLELVANKRAVYSILGRICPPDDISHIQSLLLRSILMQLNHHIFITPSDIQRCIPIVHDVADRFHRAWLDRKKYLEEQRQKQEELYQYKTCVTSLGNEPDFERREFIEVCTKFPIYDHVYQGNIASKAEKLSADEENLATEAKIINLNRNVNLSMCIDVCKAHYKFMKEASSNLLGQRSNNDPDSSPDSASVEVKDIIKIEAEVLYTIMRQCAPNFDKVFDSLSLECHLLQANELINLFKQEPSSYNQQGSLRSTIEILDENIFDIYHDADVREALRLQEFMSKVDLHVQELRVHRIYEGHPALNDITRLTAKISSFLITDPLMKFVTGAHMLLQCIEEYNHKVPREHRLSSDYDELIDLIKAWREVEVKCWRNSLHRVKKKYIDDSLCDLWFQLYEAFRDPANAVKQKCIQQWDIEEDDYDLGPDQEMFYHCFVQIIIEFLEQKTLGDYQIRLDLVFSFAIQTRFASLFEQSKMVKEETNELKHESGPGAPIDYDKLTTYVYNTYCVYQDQFEPLKDRLELVEKKFSSMLLEQIRIVNWQGRNAWDIKTNFRISHRKLNSVMNKYLDSLREDEIGRRTNDSLSDKPFGLKIRPDRESISHNLSERFRGTINQVEEVRLTTDRMTANLNNLTVLVSASKSTQKMKTIVKEVCQLSLKHYIPVLESIESSIEYNEDSIRNFHSHRVEALTLQATDSKQVREDKMKTCRQMYHAKKFAMQAVFKNLQDLGVSHQRGLNSRNLSDTMMLSIEPLRGLIQVQCRSTMKTSSELVNDSLISSCNELFRKMLTVYQFFLNQPSDRDDIDSEQKSRLLGFTFDIVINIFLNNRNAAMVYRNFMDIQAATTRLKQLQNRHEESKHVVVYKFTKIHNFIQVFDEVVGRTLSSFYKLDLLMDCCRCQDELWNLADESDTNLKTEGAILRELIGEIDEKNCLMTSMQFNHVKQNLNSIRKSVSSISVELKDKLKCTMRNYIYSEDDIEHLRLLYDQFIEDLDRLFLPGESRRQPNMQSGTIMGSMNLLFSEARQKLGPLLENLGSSGENIISTIDDIPNAQKLNMRLHKLIKSAKLVSQDAYKLESEFGKLSRVVSESEKRNSLPFNHIDSIIIRNFLRPHKVSKYLANCLRTVNMSDNCNMEAFVTTLAPILDIYTHNLTCYLNLILSSMQLKLISANLLIPFFTDLMMKGFGMPCKIQELEDQAKDSKSSNPQEAQENTGFGEGQGEKDASEKIEFESQLDELKHDDKENGQHEKEEAQGENGQRDEEEPIKASDNGIEMTDDFDAKAQGQDQEAGDEQETEEQTEDEKQLQAELDKKFDQVDEDEDHLDQQLWDEGEDKQDDLDVKDDEIDLRETDVDKSVKPDMDEIDLMAKNDNLMPSSDNSHDKENEKDQKGEQTVENDLDMQSISDIDDDLVKDAAEPDENEDGPTNDTNLEIDMEDLIDKEADDLHDITAMSDITDEQESFNGPDSHDMEIDESNEIETLNDDISEEIPLDSGETDPKDDSARQSGLGGMDASETRNDGSEVNENQNSNQNEHSDKDEDSDTSDKAIETLKQSDKGNNLGGVEEHNNETNNKPANKDNPNDDDDSSAKRTFAQRDNLETQEMIKRQKIEAAQAQGDAKTTDDNLDEGEEVRHIEADKSDAIEVIDLASDSDSDILRDPASVLERIELEESSSTRRPTSTRDQRQQTADGQDAISSEDDENWVDHNPSSYNTNLGLLRYITHEQRRQDKDNAEQNEDSIMEQIDNELSMNKSTSTEHESIEMDKLTTLWSECTGNTNHLVHELCQQLQIVLQPTKMSKYRGDYKTGKRLNMRKIITYIASHYRKDKIWLRRTKPNKRTYNISLAVDNSSSMSENNCRAMTYQSLALLARSLSLIEAGSLSVLKFGEKVQCIHEFGQPYMDAIGAQWLKELRFNERRTSYSRMLKFSCEAFAKQAQQSYSTQADAQSSVHQLLIVISDGRNVTSEEEEVKSYLRILKSLGVLTLIVIIDNLKQNAGKSIVDVKSCIRFEGSGPDKKAGGIRVENYMDVFPFPFYVLLRQIESMPSILGDALRQWFELVSNTR